MGRIQTHGARQAVIALALLVGAFGALPHAAAAQTPAPATRKPTVAVIQFDNAAMVKRDEFAAMTIGVQVMLTNSLATNAGIDIVEREKIQDILNEQNLTTAGRIDPATASKVGKILGARYVLMGAIIVDPSNEMRLSVRAVNRETSAIEYTEDVSGKGDKIFKLVDQLAGKINAGLKLPGFRAEKTTKELGTEGPNQLAAMKAMSAARRLEEQGDTKGAIAMYQKTLELNGDLGVVRTRLAMLEQKPK